MLHGQLRKSEWQQDAQHWLEINPENNQVYVHTSSPGRRPSQQEASKCILSKMEQSSGFW
jgi:hypothetical protein